MPGAKACHQRNHPPYRPSHRAAMAARLLLPSAPLPPDTLLQRLPPDAAADEKR